MLFFNFFELFCFFFGILYYALGRKEAERQYIFSFFLGIFQPILALNEAILTFFNFLIFFFGIFYSAPGRNEAERQYLFSFFLGLFQPILALNEAILGFFNFLNFFAILNFATGRDGTKL